MKFAVVCLFAIVYVSAIPDDYTHKFDNINVDEILRNKRLLKKYVDCLLEKPGNRCPPAAAELKSVISEALETECAKCSERQKEIVKKTIKYLIEHESEIWKELKAKYDPEGKYVKKYEDEAKKENVELK